MGASVFGARGIAAENGKNTIAHQKKRNWAEAQKTEIDFDNTLIFSMTGVSVVDILGWLKTMLGTIV